ncbi:MAG: histidine kinase [Prevotella sp.]|jgi:sensor histidine kinase YesM|nr:histidine kinase [Prevotella sp.]
MYATNRMLVVPLYLRGRWHRATATTIVAFEVVVMMMLTSQAEGWPFRQLSVFYLETRKVEMSQQRAWLFFLMVEAFSLAVSTLSELARQRILQQEAEMERDRAQLALYQAQFEPHFIYNSLNALYGLIVTRDSRAEQSFMKFIELTRYTCSFVVGLAHIASYNRRMVIVNGYSQSLPIGRTYAVEIDKCL